MSRDVGSPQALAAIERARKLLALAYDKGATPGERSVALKKAGDTLRPFGLTVDDLKQEATPEYLRGAKQVVGGYNANRAGSMASTLRQRGWKSIDPSSEAYKNRSGGEGE